MWHLRLPCVLSLMLFFWPLLSNAQQASSSRKIISLDGSGWKLVGLDIDGGEKLGVNLADSAKADFIPTSIPNDVQLAIGLKDPYGQGPELWNINKREWWYVRSFASPKVTPSQQARLVFDGVDYFADVWLNGEKLGSHEGAYTHFSFDITKRLREKEENYLGVRVTSPWKVPGRSRYEFMKAHFVDGQGWDALPGPGQVVFPLGLHRSVRLEVTSAARLEEIQVITTGLRGQDADLKLQVTVSNAGPLRQGALQVSIRPKGFSGPTLDLPPQSIAFTGQTRETQETTLVAQLKQARLWWTWDQGPQKLYTAEAILVDHEGKVADQLSVTFGVRTVEQDSNLLYRLNGRPVLLRGAWGSMFTLYPGAADRWVYEKDLRLARHAHMNHLLCYTVIERDEFYDLADQLGILLFIELPFNQYGPFDAVSKTYPRRDEFLRWSSGEVAKIVRSLANHPSVGVWSALSETTGGGGSFRRDGYELFSEKMQEVARQNDPDALYFRSYCDFGERHFWDGGLFNGTTYDGQFDAQAGFVSEYGAEALFPLEDVRRVLNPEELWSGGPFGYSSLALPVNIKKFSSVHPMRYWGLDLVTSSLAANVDRHIRSFQDYASGSQVYQAFFYAYSGDAFRRKLFAPINGIRSWMFKSFAEKPIGGFGVIDSFSTPTKGYYVQRRTFAPVAMSYAVRYALESVPAGSEWKVPVWISNSSDEPLSLSVESVLYNLKGERLRESRLETSVPALQAREAGSIHWRLPEEPGIYLLRGHARQGEKYIASAEMYMKVAPRAMRKALRVLVLGTPTWGPPVADYLKNLGAQVTPVIYDSIYPTVSEVPSNPFPGSAEELRKNYDVIWLTGFERYWTDAPEEVTQTIVQAVNLGATFVHTGSWASFHGGVGLSGPAALDLTPLAQILPVDVRHESDAFPRTYYRTGDEVNTPPPMRGVSITAAATAPAWLREVDFGGLVPESYHLLDARPDAKVLLLLADQPLLVSGHYGKGLTLAYLGFSPEGSKTLLKEQKPIVVDRAIRSSEQGRLFTIISAALLALASGEEPPARLGDLVQARATPLYETLKNTPVASWPDVNLTWTAGAGKSVKAQLHIRNGLKYLYGLRLRLDGPDFRDGKALSLWSDQFFDLLPSQEADASVEIITSNGSPLRAVSLVAETLYGTESKSYPVPAPPQ